MVDTTSTPATTASEFMYSADCICICISLQLTRSYSFCDHDGIVVQHLSFSWSSRTKNALFPIRYMGKYKYIYKDILHLLHCSMWGGNKSTETRLLF